MDVTLWPRELSWILDLDQDDEVQVVPHVVLSPDVFFKRHIFVVKFLTKVSSFYLEYNWPYAHLPFQSTYKTGILDNFFLVLLFGSQISKSVDDDTENKIKYDDDNHEKEEHIID